VYVEDTYKVLNFNLSDTN